MDSTRHYSGSSLFLIRLWANGSTGEQVRWSGKVQHVVTGEAHEFHSWPEMLSAMQSMLPKTEAGEQVDGGSNEEVTRTNPLTRLFARQQGAKA